MTEEQKTELAKILGGGFNEIMKNYGFTPREYNKDLEPVYLQLIKFINNREIEDGKNNI